MSAKTSASAIPAMWFSDAAPFYSAEKIVNNEVKNLPIALYIVVLLVLVGGVFATPHAEH